jgi:peptidyl-dipeptidase A
VKSRHALPALAAIAAILSLTGCDSRAQQNPGAAAKATPADADAFVARVNEDYKANSPEVASAQWIAATYINSDSQLVAAKASERSLARLGVNIEASKAYDGLDLSTETARGIHLLKLATSMPAPRDPKKLAELTQIATKMEAMYGSGEYCTGEGEARQCRNLGQLEDVLRTSRDYDAQRTRISSIICGRTRARLRVTESTTTATG